jgi:hypothetical protein
VLLIKNNTSNLSPLDSHVRNRPRQHTRDQIPLKHRDPPVPLRADGDEGPGLVDGELARHQPARPDGLHVRERAGPAVDGEGDERVARVRAVGLAAGGDEEEFVVGLFFAGEVLVSMHHVIGAWKRVKVGEGKGKKVACLQIDEPRQR